MKRILIAGMEMIPSKKTFVAIQRIYGIGKTISVEIAEKLNIKDKKINSLSQDEIDRLKKEIEKYTIEDDLKRKIHDNIKDLKDIKSRRGLRLALGLPNRGQRTSSNAKTSKKLKR